VSETSATLPVAPVSPAMKRQFDAQGYLILRGVFAAAEVAAAAEEADRLLEEYRGLIDTNNIRCRWQNHVLTDECLFDAFDPVIDLGPVCHRLATDARVLEVIGALYGERACLFKDKLIFKPPGARGYDLHQDYISWKSFPRTFVTAEIAIDPADPENGCTEVFPGYHHNGYLSPTDGDYHPLPVAAVDESRAVPLALAPGDVGLFGGYVPHRSGPNRSERWRRQLYVSYNAMSEGGDCREAHYREFHAWLKVKYAEYGKTDTYFE
jgi:ectoine hydroxylase-related dioxygenase (phytanoyl-CoA dioxygenase family)